MAARSVFLSIRPLRALACVLVDSSWPALTRTLLTLRPRTLGPCNHGTYQDPTCTSDRVLKVAFQKPHSRKFIKRRRALVHLMRGRGRPWARTYHVCSSERIDGASLFCSPPLPLSHTVATCLESRGTVHASALCVGARQLALVCRRQWPK